jgi:protein SCO1
VEFVAKNGVRKVSAVAALLFALISLVQAQQGPGGMFGGGDLPSTALPPDLSNVRFDQMLGARVPLDAPFRDENGNQVTLRQYFKPGRPVVLSLVYYDCPMLCTQVLNGMASTLHLLNFNIGKDYEVVTVSFDPREKPKLAAAKKKAYLIRLDRSGGEQGWHFLTGDEPSIKQLTDAVGFHYQWDEKMQQYAHASGIMVVTPDGKLSHYFYGVDYAPRDLRLALVEASNLKIGTPVDAALLYCARYDPRTGKYSIIVLRVVRIAGVLTVLLLGSFLIYMSRTEKRQPLTREAAVGRLQHMSNSK